MKMLDAMYEWVAVRVLTFVLFFIAALTSLIDPFASRAAMFDVLLRWVKDMVEVTER